MEIREYELIPDDGRKSFYHKARVRLEPSGAETLISYNTPVMRREPSGQLVRLWDDWSATTGRHVRAFCGINKAAWDKMPVEPRPARSKMAPDMSPEESYRAMIGRRMIG